MTYLRGSGTHDICQIENPEINSDNYYQVIYNKWGWNMQCRKESLFNKWCWENWTATYKRMRLEHFLTPYIKINLEWIKNINVRSATIKLLEENRGIMLFNISLVQFSRSVMSNSLWPHGLQHARPTCPSPTPRVYSNSCPLRWWGYPTISSSVVPFSSCLQSFPASGSFQMNQLFAPGGQSIGVSAST